MSVEGILSHPGEAIQAVGVGKKGRVEKGSTEKTKELRGDHRCTKKPKGDKGEQDLVMGEKKERCACW